MFACSSWLRLGALVALTISLAPAVPAGAQAGAQWPQFLGNDAHTSYVADPAISASSASSMGVKWMANLYNVDLGSPVVAYNAALKEELVYVGDEQADVFAIDAVTGQQVWSTNLGYGDRINATPVVAPDGTVWVATNFKAALYKLNGATGAVECSVKSPDGAPIMGSPLVVAPPGGSTNVYWISNDGATVSGPIVSTNESSCATNFQFYQYRTTPAGGWASPAYALSASGEPLIIEGTADPDSTVYAVDANTGALVWRYSTYIPGDYDVGDGATISAPGSNGFADGVVYVDNKYGYEYALNLTTGKLIWKHDVYPANYTGFRVTISSSALDGNQVVFGYLSGLTSLNATSGSKVWSWTAPAEVDDSPAIVGPSGNEAVAFADLTGAFRLAALATGTQLYKYQTGGYITSSPAVYNGTIYIASSDGFLYAFAPGGANVPPPSGEVTAPESGAQHGNPNGSLTVSGLASDARSVASVEIAVQSGGSTGPWYSAATNSWGSAPARNAASLTSPGATNTNWTFALPVPAAGGTYTVFVNAVNGSHIVDRGRNRTFSVRPSADDPTVTATSYYIVPGSTFRGGGRGFLPGEQVTFSLLGVTARTTVEKSGTVPPTKIAVPTTAAFGPVTLTATGGTSLKSSSTTVYVTNAWTQLGYNALRGAAEPNDKVIQNTLDVGNDTILAKSWVYASGAAINTEPAVLNGVAYVGNDAGVLSAVNTQAGSPVWTYKIPSGAPIRSSPAVDGSGNVIFGANDGNLYVLNASGSLLKTIALGGNLGAPAFDDGTIVVASDNGTIASIADPAWATNWTVNAGAAVHSPPSFDATNAIVIAGNDGGTIRAYASATGAVLWTANASGAVTAPPAIYNGVVYVGSAGGKMYAFTETSGALQWSYQADSAIAAGIAVGVNDGTTILNFGTNSGAVYELTLTGALKYSKAALFAASPVVGFSAAGDTAFTTMTIGTIGVLRDFGGGWSFKSGGSATVPPAILNGSVYFGAGNGNLYAFSPNGATPLSVVRTGGVIVSVTSDWTCTTQQ